MVKAIEKIMDAIDKCVQVVCTVMTLVMTIVVLIQVFARYIPAIKPPAWTEEFARYTMIWLSMIAASHGIKLWNNVGVDFFLKKMPQKLHHVVDIVIKIVVLAVLIIVLKYSLKVFPKVGMRQLSATLRVPMFYAQLGIIIGFIICCIQLVGRLIVDIARGGKKE
jgi:TRAP-type C4-dicarboxylate transport system permease small subunit